MILPLTRDKNSRDICAQCHRALIGPLGITDWCIFFISLTVIKLDFDHRRELGETLSHDLQHTKEIQGVDL